jgi:hypothetical protein
MATLLSLESNSIMVNVKDYAAPETLILQLHDRLRLSPEKLKFMENEYLFFITKMSELDFRDFVITEYRK